VVWRLGGPRDKGAWGSRSGGLIVIMLMLEDADADADAAGGTAEDAYSVAEWQVRKGDILVRFAGVPDRKAEMRRWLEMAEERSAEWEVPLEQTRYPAETKAF